MKRKIIIITVLVIILLLVIIGFMYYKNTKQSKEENTIMPNNLENNNQNVNNENITNSNITNENLSIVVNFNFETKTVKLNSGYEMPLNGIGTYSLTGDTCYNSIISALNSGVRLIDTAYMYSNEE